MIEMSGEELSQVNYFSQSLKASDVELMRQLQSPLRDRLLVFLRARMPENWPRYLALAEREVPDYVVVGKDLLALGMQPGPACGALLREIETKRLMGELVTYEDALSYARVHFSCSN